jgi:hypothetical protein
MDSTQNIVIPASIVIAAIEAFAADREAQRRHEAAMAATIFDRIERTASQLVQLKMAQMSQTKG